MLYKILVDLSLSACITVNYAHELDAALEVDVLA